MEDQQEQDKTERPFRQARRDRLALLIEEAGSAIELALLSGTPDSHISAVLRGKRGIGDDLATKLEAVMGKPLGWMDMPVEASAGIDWHTTAVNLAMSHKVPEYQELLIDFVQMVRAERTRAMQAIAERAKQHTPKGVKG